MPWIGIVRLNFLKFECIINYLFRIHLYLFFSDNIGNRLTLNPLPKPDHINWYWSLNNLVLFGIVNHLELQYIRFITTTLVRYQSLIVVLKECWRQNTENDQTRNNVVSNHTTEVLVKDVFIIKAGVHNCDKWFDWNRSSRQW